MPKQWNGTLATQTVAFRGTSRVDIMSAGAGAQNFRTISRAAYSVRVVGGISGANFGAHILGYLGNSTVVLAGVTALTVAGTYVMYPVGYTNTGAAGAVGAVGLVDGMNRLDWTVPPTAVVFQSGVATAGISANMTVSAVLHQEN
jgi:hypothetical protein